MGHVKNKDGLMNGTGIFEKNERGKSALSLPQMMLFIVAVCCTNCVISYCVKMINNKIIRYNKVRHV